GTVGPDVIEDAVIGNAVASADSHLAVPKDVPGKAEAWSEILVACGPHAADLAHAQAGETGRVENLAANVSELRQDSFDFARSAEAVPTESQVHGEAAADLNVVLHEPVVIVIDEVTIGVGFRTGCRIDRPFLKIGIIASEVGIALTTDVGDCAIRLQCSIIC